jgi:hypothetical protein
MYEKRSFEAMVLVKIKVKLKRMEKKNTILMVFGVFAALIARV